ncbi:hypothetical protein NR798_43290 [Archangium gephyra]|uniref:hypothetical protein n=1 Tax=Archangium gephyra TaxID=48 RepID=UPI0035D4CFB9
MGSLANHAPFLRALHEAPLVLAEGSVVERLRRYPAGLLDPHVANAGLLFVPEGREALAGARRWRASTPCPARARRRTW